MGLVAVLAALALCVALVVAAPLRADPLAGDIQLLDEGISQEPAITFAPLEKEKADRETAITGLNSKVSANLKSIQEAETTSAAASKSLQDGLDAEVKARGDEVTKAIDAADSVKTSVGKVEEKVKSDSATLSAAVSKLDTALGAQKKSTEEGLAKAQSNVEDERKSSEEEVKNMQTKVEGDMSKLTTDVSKSMQNVEAAVTTTSQKITAEEESRAKEDSEQAKIIAALNAKVVNLANTVSSLQQGMNTPSPSTGTATAANTTATSTTVEEYAEEYLQ